MFREKLNIAFIPGGEMNLALALVATRNGHCVTVWNHSRESHDYILRNNESPNPKWKGIKLDGINFTPDIEEALWKKDLVYVTPKAENLRETFRNSAPFMGNKIVVTSSKGFDELDGQYYTPSQVAQQEIPDVSKRSCVLSGGNFARQIALGKITGTTIAASNCETAEEVRYSLDCNNFLVDVYKGRLYDVELIGAFKNVIGMAMGFAMAHPDFDENTGALITQKGLEEATVLCNAMGCDFRVLLEHCGIGDIALLMNSKTSRNVEAGYNYAMGIWSREELFNPDKTIEGVRAVKFFRELSRQHGILMPLTSMNYQIIHKGRNPREAVENLLYTRRQWIKTMTLEGIRNGNGEETKEEKVLSV